MLFVDDLPVVFIFQRILPELECNLFFQFRDEPVFHGGVAEDVVGSHAGLAAVYKFSEDDAPGRQGDVGGFVYDTGALSAKLQGNRRQVFRRLPHDLFPDRLAAGKENVVEIQAEKAGILRSSAVYHSHKFRGEAALQHLRHGSGGVGRVGAGLDHSGVSRGDGVHQGIDGQEKRIVPGAHDQHAAVGGGLFKAPGHVLGQRGGNAFFPGKTGHMAQHVAQLALDQSDLAHVAFRPAFSQIGPKGGDQFFLKGVDGGAKPAQGRFARLHGQCLSGGKIVLLSL